MPTERLNLPDPPVKAEDTSPATFFKEVYQTFRQAERLAGGPVDRFYTIGGYTVQLRFAGPALVPSITPALEHLATEPGSAPALTVCLWDSASTRTRMPPPPWSADVYVGRGDIRGYNNDRIRTSYRSWAGVLSMLDSRLGLAVFWTRDACQVPYYESGAPLRMILHWWACSRGLQYAHAAAIGMPAQGGVLVVGKGGTGKSTTALACLNSELLYVGDDYCLLATNPVPYAYSLYNSAKLDVNHIQRFPHLVSAISNADHLDTEKALLFLHRHYPGKTAQGFPIRATLVSRVVYRPETTLIPVSPMAGLKALVPSTIFQLSGAGSVAFRTMAEFVRRVPCYRLELGTDLCRIPEVIFGLLSDG